MKKGESAVTALEEITEQAATLYDANAIQKIPLTITKGSKSYDVAIELEPITDDEYFQLIDDALDSAKKLKSVSIELFQPRADLARKKAIARYGYVENKDWKTATKDADFISALDSYLQVSANTESESVEDLLDDSDETPIVLASVFNGIETKTTIYFREETKAQMDEFLAIDGGLPQKNALASHKKISKQKRLFALYEALVKGSDGYASQIPAWHGLAAVAAYLSGQLQRMGKF